MPVVVRHSEKSLPPGVSLLGGEPGPAHRLPVVLRHTTPVVVHHPEESLRVGVSLLGEHSIRFRGDCPACVGVSCPAIRLRGDFAGVRVGVFPLGGNSIRLHGDFPGACVGISLLGGHSVRLHGDFPGAGRDSSEQPAGNAQTGQQQPRRQLHHGTTVSCSMGHPESGSGLREFHGTLVALTYTANNAAQPAVKQAIQIAALYASFAASDGSCPFCSSLPSL